MATTSSSWTETKLEASDGAASAAFGRAVALVGDVDGDGYSELVVGADGDASYVGAAYLYFGGPTGLDVSTEIKLVAPVSATSGSFGRSVAPLGDLDGDGYADFVVGASTDDSASRDAGAMYVHFGSSSGVDSSRTTRVTASDANGGEMLGERVAGLGDVDGDGYPDFAGSAPWEDDVASNSGSVYVYYGCASGVDTTRETKLTASDAGSDDSFGYGLSAAGDVDGDGYRGILVGSYMDDDEGSNAGAAYLFDGSASGIDATTEQKLTGTDTTTEDAYGRAVTGGADLNNDGYDDIVIAAPQDDDGAQSTGSVYVYYGSSTGITTASEQKLTASDAARHDFYGISVATGGDVDADGYPDLVVGAYGVDYSSSVTEAGAIYVLYGSTTGISTASETKVTTSDGVTNDQFAMVVAASDDVNGDGQDDIVGGAVGVDGLGANSGAAYVYRGLCPDADGDGVCASADCDDTDATRYPSATEVVGDEIDSDCDGVEICYADADGDGYTDGTTTVVSADTDCADSGEALATAPTGDCDDTDASRNPGATDTIGDESDSDCDGMELCYADLDGDGYTDGGAVSSSDEDCQDPTEATASVATGDCDDGDARRNPGAAELVGDEVDSDCDGSELCYADGDDDGYLGLAIPIVSADADCDDSGELDASAPTGDCDDSNWWIHPDAAEVCDGSDNDCDGTVDVGAEDERTWYADADGDGFGDPTHTVAGCEQPEGGVADATDCDDEDPATFPGAGEIIADGIDENCDGGELCYVDRDEDGYRPDGETTVESPDLACDEVGEADATDFTGDCDDTDPGIHPDAEDPQGDGIDQDCDGADGEAVTEDTGGDTADDDGDDDDDDDKSGCSNRPGAPSLVLALGAAFLGLRRRQHPPKAARGRDARTTPRPPQA